jgi:ATP-dependent Clp protease protease subunit
MRDKVAPAGKGPTGYRMAAKSAAGAKTAEIFLYGPIGNDWWSDSGVSANQFAKDLRALGDVSAIDLRINSEGGLVNDARAIYTLLVEHKAKVTTHIDGLAASSASFIALAGEEVIIAEGGFYMIHNPHAYAQGTAKDFRDMASVLDLFGGTILDTYAARSNATTAQIKAWMDNETWFTGPQAVEHGFATSLAENLRVAACVSNPDRFKNMPASLARPRLAEARARIASRIAA